MNPKKVNTAQVFCQTNSSVSQRAWEARGGPPNLVINFPDGLHCRSGSIWRQSIFKTLQVFKPFIC